MADNGVVLRKSLYKAEQKLLVIVFPSYRAETDKASQKVDDFVPWK